MWDEKLREVLERMALGRPDSKNEPYVVVIQRHMPVPSQGVSAGEYGSHLEDLLQRDQARAERRESKGESCDGWLI